MNRSTYSQLWSTILKNQITKLCFSSTDSRFENNSTFSSSYTFSVFFFFFDGAFSVFCNELSTLINHLFSDTTLQIFFLMEDTTLQILYWKIVNKFNQKEFEDMLGIKYMVKVQRTNQKTFIILTNFIYTPHVHTFHLYC